jgi:hypothetical protein
MVSLFALPASAALVTYEIKGFMDGGGPSFCYPTASDPSVKDIDSPFTLLLTIDEMQTGDGAGGYKFSSATFTVHGTDNLGNPGFFPDYVATLNSSLVPGGGVQNITVMDGGTDKYIINMQGNGSAGPITGPTNPVFTGDEVFRGDTDGSGASDSGLGKNGLNDRFFGFVLEDNTGASATGGSNPSLPDLTAWNVTNDKDHVRIRWRDSSKISLKGSFSSITIVPEPSALIAMGLATLGWFFWRHLNRP